MGQFEALAQAGGRGMYAPVGARPQRPRANVAFTVPVVRRHGEHKFLYNVRTTHRQVGGHCADPELKRSAPVASGLVNGRAEAYPGQADPGRCSAPQ